jgi:hypothetical protein
MTIMTITIADYTLRHLFRIDLVHGTILNVEYNISFFWSSVPQIFPKYPLVLSTNTTAPDFHPSPQSSIEGPYKDMYKEDHRMITQYLLGWMFLCRLSHKILRKLGCFHSICRGPLLPSQTYRRAGSIIQPNSVFTRHFPAGRHSLRHIPFGGAQGWHDAELSPLCHRDNCHVVVRIILTVTTVAQWPWHLSTERLGS